jgi:hypothetical protein
MSAVNLKPHGYAVGLRLFYAATVFGRRWLARRWARAIPRHPHVHKPNAKGDRYEKDV